MNDDSDASEGDIWHYKPLARMRKRPIGEAPCRKDRKKRIFNFATTALSQPKVSDSRVFHFSRSCTAPAAFLEDGFAKDLGGNSNALQMRSARGVINTRAAQSQSSAPSSHSGIERTTPHQISQHSHHDVTHDLGEANVSSAGWLHDIIDQGHPTEQNIYSAEARLVQLRDSASNDENMRVQLRSTGEDYWKQSPMNNNHNNVSCVETQNSSCEMSRNATADDSGYVSPAQDASFLSVIRSGGKHFKLKRCRKANSPTKSSPLITSSPAAETRALLPDWRADQRPEETITEIPESSISDEDGSDEEDFRNVLLKPNLTRLKQHQIRDLQQQLGSSESTGSHLIPNKYGNCRTGALGAAVSYKDSLLQLHTQTQGRNRMLQDITESVYGNQSVASCGQTKHSAPSSAMQNTPLGPQICDDFSDSDDFEQSMTPRRFGSKNPDDRQANGEGGQQRLPGTERDDEGAPRPEGSRFGGIVKSNRPNLQSDSNSTRRESAEPSRRSEETMPPAFRENVENDQFWRKGDRDICFDLVVVEDEEEECTQINSRACGNRCTRKYDTLTQSTQTSPDIKSSIVGRLKRRGQPARALRGAATGSTRRTKGDSAERLPFSPILYAASSDFSSQGDGCSLTPTPRAFRGVAQKTFPFILPSDLERLPTRGNLFRAMTDEAARLHVATRAAAVNYRGSSRMMRALDAANERGGDERPRAAVSTGQKPAARPSMGSVRGPRGRRVSQNCSDAAEFVSSAAARQTTTTIANVDGRPRPHASCRRSGAKSAGGEAANEQGDATLPSMAQRDSADAGAASLPGSARSAQLPGGAAVDEDGVASAPHATESQVLNQQQLSTSTYSRPVRRDDGTTSSTLSLGGTVAPQNRGPSVSDPSVCKDDVPSSPTRASLSAHSSRARPNDRWDHSYNIRDIEGETCVNANHGQMNTASFYGQKQQLRSRELSGRLSKNLQNRTDDSANKTPPAQQPTGGQVVSRLRAMIEKAENRQKQISAMSRTTRVLEFPPGQQNGGRHKRGSVTPRTWDARASPANAHEGRGNAPKEGPLLWTRYGDDGAPPATERVPAEEAVEEEPDRFERGEASGSPNGDRTQISRRASTGVDGSGSEVANVRARGGMSSRQNVLASGQNVLASGGATRRARIGGKVVRRAPSRQEVERRLLQSGISVERMANAGKKLPTSMQRRKRDAATSVAANREGASGATRVASGTVEGNDTFTSKIPGTSFAVDAFSCGAVASCSAHFLSHFHPHAYRGLSRSFDRPIYCSKVTADLANCKLGVQDAHLHRLPLNTVSVVNGVRVVLIDANHCAGASMFLFMVPDGRTILYTGHFRASAAMERNLQLAARRVDVCYMDTTCLPLEKEPPAREDVLRFATRLASSAVARNPRTMLACGYRAPGDEKLCLALAEAVGCRAAMAMENYDTLQLLGTGRARDLVTLDWHATRLHALAITKLSFKGLSAHLRRFSAQYDYLLAFKPVAQWDFTGHSRLSDIQPHISQNVIIYGVPFVDHSSRSELKRFVQWLRPRSLVPVAPATTRRSAAASEGILRKWLSDIGTFPVRPTSDP
ncbi:unnamed protein product [Lampetra planeri]